MAVQIHIGTYERLIGPLQFMLTEVNVPLHCTFGIASLFSPAESFV